MGGALLIGGQAVGLLDDWGFGMIALGLFLLWRAWADVVDRPETRQAA